VPDRMAVTNAVSTFVATLIGRPVDPDEPLISSQLLESIAAVRLIAFIEESLGVTVEDDDLALANFDTVRAIVALVNERAATV
jgi:methoxymalonate biosynthesis acyl carrier protein